MGNLGQKPELKSTTKGDTVMRFTLATQEPERQQDGSWGTRPEWHRCVFWGDRAEKLAPHLDKGSKVLVEGKLQTRQWDDQQGVTRYTTEINIKDLEFASSAQSRPADAAPEQDWVSPPDTRQTESFPHGANEPSTNGDPWKQYR
jgi:single-strand DNA-binding protein